MDTAKLRRLLAKKEAFGDVLITKPVMNQKSPFTSLQPSAPKKQTYQPQKQNPFELGGSQGQPKGPKEKPLSLGEHFDAALNYVADSLFGFGGGSDSSNKDDNSKDSGSNPFANALKKEQSKNEELQKEMKKKAHVAKMKEMNQTEVFNLEKKKSEEMIKQIKNELSQLIKEMKKMSGNVDQSIHTAVFQGTGETGQYYENFFTQLRNFLVLLTKRMKEGNTWLETFNKKKYKSKFQKNSAKYGSQYMFGQEHSITRQSG
jgi:hypothetical protein